MWPAVTGPVFRVWTAPPRDKSQKTMDYESGKILEFKDHNDREVQGAHDEKVIEAFQKFDTDGSGNISRDELAEAEGRSASANEKKLHISSLPIGTKHSSNTNHAGIRASSDRLSWSITCEVLKTLDPEEWDNEAVDELLAAADKNCDGELSVKEFLTLGWEQGACASAKWGWIWFVQLRNWAFTENDIITSGKGNVTLRVEGCPREQFNGDYVQDIHRAFV